MTTERTAAEATVGQRLTTRYFGGYQNCRVLEVHDDFYVVSMFGGQMVDALPKDRAAKIFDSDGNVVWCSEEERGPLHPAIFGLIEPANKD